MSAPLSLFLVRVVRIDVGPIDFPGNATSTEDLERRYVGRYLRESPGAYGRQFIYVELDEGPTVYLTREDAKRGLAGRDSLVREIIEFQEKTNGH